MAKDHWALRRLTAAPPTLETRHLRLKAMARCLSGCPVFDIEPDKPRLEMASQNPHNPQKNRDRPSLLVSPLDRGRIARERKKHRAIVIYKSPASREESLNYNGWEPIGNPLGQGGQGTVYKARSPDRVAERKRILSKIAHRIRQIGAVGSYSEEVPELAKEIVNAGSPDEPGSLRALKVIHLPEGDEPERQKTLGRFQSEIRALQELQHASILRLLDASHISTDPP